MLFRSEFREFGERFADVGGVARFEFDADEEGAEGAGVAVFDECFQIFSGAQLGKKQVAVKARKII